MLYLENMLDMFDDPKEFIAFSDKSPQGVDERGALYAKDRLGRIWRRIDAMEWESIPQKRGETVESMTKGLSAGEMMLLMQLNKRR